MWRAGIQAVKTSDEHWIRRHRREFHRFFEEENERPKGKLGVTALEHHYEERLFKMFLSEEFGGLELPLEKGSEWIENCAVLHPSWGWLIAIGVGGAYFADYMPVETAEAYFSPKEALVAGSGKPDGAAVKIAGDKWLVKGAWGYCSGSEQASLFTAVTTRDEKLSAFVLPVAQGRIQRDWNATGLGLTCSHSVLAENAEISGDLFFDLGGNPRYSEYSLSAYPFMLFAQVCFVPVMVGIARAFWLEVESYLEEKEDVWKEFQPDRYAFVEYHLREYSVVISDLKSKFYKLVEGSWRAHLEGGDSNEVEVSEVGLFLAEYCYSTTSAIIPKLGMGVLEEGHPLQGYWRDLQTAYQHAAFHRW